MTTRRTNLHDRGIAALALLGRRSLSRFREEDHKFAGSTSWWPDLGLVYSRVKKAGNTSVRLFLQDATAKSRGLAVAPSDVSTRGIPLSKVWKPHDLRELDAACFFTVVRNPFDRLLSAFLEKRQLAHLAQYSDIPGFSGPPIEGFSIFVESLFDSGFTDAHWEPQVKSLLLPVEAYDQVIRLENLADALPPLLQNFAAGEDSYGSPHFRDLRERGGRQRITNATQKISDYYTPRLAAAVRTLYAEDFSRLGFDPELKYAGRT